MIRLPSENDYLTEWANGQIVSRIVSNHLMTSKKGAPVFRQALTLRIGPSHLAGLLAAALLLPAGARAQVLLSDDFNDGNANGWTEFDGSFAVVGGEFVITTSGYCNDGRAVNGNPAWTDYQVDVDFLVDATTNGGHAAVLFRVQDIASGCDAGHYYQAHVFPDHVGFCLMSNSGGACTNLGQTNVQTPLQQWHHLTVRVIGTSATLIVDSVSLLTVGGLVDYPAGRIGLKSINTQAVHYDNVLVTGPGSWAWSTLTGAVAGSAGVPVLAGTGELVPSAPVNLMLSHAATFAPAYLVTGFSELGSPFKGGVMVPNPDLLLPSFTDGFGALLFGGPWPAGVPSGLQLWFQFWISDASGPVGFAASNAVRADVP